MYLSHLLRLLPLLLLKFDPLQRIFLQFFCVDYGWAQGATSSSSSSSPVFTAFVTNNDGEKKELLTLLLCRNHFSAKEKEINTFGGAKVFFSSTLHSWGHSGTTHIHILVCVLHGVELERWFNPCRVLRKNLTPFALPLCAAQISNRHAIPLSGVANLP